MRIKTRKLRFNPSRHRLLHENTFFSKSIPEGSYVLDAGAGSAPYKHLLSHTRYESADFIKIEKHYAEQTYICDLSQIPVEDERFDYIIFNQVLEHIPEPHAVISELFRVLKPGGRMIYTGPLFYEEHEIPYDFYRYTQFGVRHIFGKAGFEIERLDWLEGYFGTLGYQFATAARALPWRSADYGGGLLGPAYAALGIPLRIMFKMLSIFFNRLEVRHKFTKNGLPKNYFAILRKPPESKLGYNFKGSH